MRTNDEIKSIVESAFQPLRCVAEIRDYQEKLNFRICDPNDQPLIRLENAKLDHIRSDDQLSSLIEDVRERVEAKGHSLAPWQLPPKAATGC